MSARFRLRPGDGRFAPASFPPALRLHSTFPFAELQAEAKSKLGNQNLLSAFEVKLLNKCELNVT
jgi:hypothetical protein